MFRKFRFQTKMILVPNIVLLVVAVAIAGIFYERIRNTMMERSREDFRIVSDSAASQIDNHFYMMDKTALQIAANPDIVRLFFNTGHNSGFNYFAREPLVNAEVVRLLNSYNFKRDGFERICLYNGYHDFVYTATAPTTESGIEQWFAGRKFSEVEHFFAEEGNFVFYIEPSEDILNDTGLSRQPYFSVIRQIKNYTTNDQACGYVEVQEFVRWIDRIVEDAGEDTYGAMLDEEGKIVYLGPSAGTQEGEAEFSRIVSGIGGKEGWEKLVRVDGVADGKDGLLYVKKLENAPYRIVFAKEKGSEFSFFSRYNQVILLTVFLILVTAVVTEILLVRRLSKPLEELNCSVRRVTLSHPQLEVKGAEDNDELVRLQWTFNAMIGQMKEAMEREYASLANEMKAQLLAFQSQMNPHFLHNILAIISIEAQEYGNDKIPDMCTRLRRMMAYSSSMENGYSRMKNELDYVLDYMELMKVRYEELFEYELESDERLWNARIPKYILQPICENSFKHSLKNVEPVWKIRIAVYEKDGKWMVEIHDNGTGFTEEYLKEFEKIKEELTLEKVRDKLQESKVGGLGILNIYMRMMLCYEEGFVFRLDNDEEGAVVLLGGVLDDQSSCSGGRASFIKRDQQTD